MKGNVKMDTPFWDSSLTDEERIDWLLAAMTLEEKLRYISSFAPDLERLGIPGISLGGEAAHGVEGRNDQNGVGVADVTTSFPQPIGMSASWDRELIRQAGEITGIEARVAAHRHENRGLSRWAPTVDLERDPRWGRNEEGYGEDPVLTGAMAGAYIRGMQGEHPRFLRIASTLKHFYGNNTEEGRGWKNSSMDPRNEYELYLEPFRRCIEEGGAEGVMTAYNRVNGTVGVLNPEVSTILKKRYGLTHAVSDGGAVGLVVTAQHYFGQHAETVAAALKAGVDAMSDNPDMVAQAAAEAFELGLIGEEDLDLAIRCTMRTKLRLGVYDRENVNPFDRVTEKDIDSPRAREICKRLSGESIVLLKNENDMLPLDASLNPKEIALVGPMGDVWYHDWYGGCPPYTTTLRQGLEQLCGKELPFADGLDRVTLSCQGKAVGLSPEGALCVTKEPEIFIRENWGEGHFTLRSQSTGKYICVHLGDTETIKSGQMTAERTEPFDWFVVEILHIEEQGDGTVLLANRFHHPIHLEEDGTFLSMDGREGTPFQIQVVESGIEKAAELARDKRVVLLALGSHSMINAKEEIDRKTLCLAPDQERLLERVCAVNPNTVLVLFANYPYTIVSAQEKVPAILLSATGSQDMGSAMAETLFGQNAPAGRLNMTWYRDVSQLPDIDDYDIIKGKRTYRYFDGEVLYPFGYGLTYTSFAYRDLSVRLKDDHLLEVALTVENTGNRTSDEVVQVYGKAPASRVKKPLRQLLGFERVREIAPGEKRRVCMEIPVQEFRFYDVISRRLIVEEGTYRIFAGGSCMDEAVSAEVFLPGEKTGLRDLAKRTAADHYDDYENMILTEGHFGYKAMTLLDGEKEGRLIYRDCDPAKTEGVLSLHLKSERGVRVEVYVNGRLAGSFEGDTRTCELRSAPKMDLYADREIELRNRQRVPLYEDIDIALEGVEKVQDPVCLELRVRGDARICFFRTSGEAVRGQINIGVAN